MKYIFDGSYPGYLTGMFECFERSEWNAVPFSEIASQESLFDDYRKITTDPAKAKRVADGLVKRLGNQGANGFFQVFLSEDPKAWLVGYRLMRRIFTDAPDILKNFGDADVLHFSQTLKKIGRERHRMKAFIRFSKCADGLFFATVEPDFNVLPLIAAFFRNRYTDQPWLIYDAKRNYGILYDLTAVREVLLTADASSESKHPVVSTSLDERDELFKRLWKQYFKSTNIAARRNLKLHLQHVPRRYWKYLVEKN